ncbi:MAG: hypothetical protein AB1896_19740 [Thermodesulfobacteriota bacterium]
MLRFFVTLVLSWIIVVLLIIGVMVTGWGLQPQSWLLVISGYLFIQGVSLLLDFIIRDAAKAAGMVKRE